jgi:hypothetical protein
MSDDLSEDILRELERLSDAADPPPWRAMIEGRDHTSGDDFIMVGEIPDRREDISVLRDYAKPARAEELDVIAAARNALPLLIEEIRRLRGAI